MAAALWYVMQRGSRLGPFPAETLQRMVDYGEVSPDDLVWCDGMADWVKARTVIKPSDYRAPEPRRRERYDDRDDRYDDRREDREGARRGPRYDDDREPLPAMRRPSGPPGQFPGRLITPGFFFLALLLFFCPWVDVHCGGQTLVSQSGLQLCFGGYSESYLLELERRNGRHRIPHNVDIKPAPLMIVYGGLIIAGLALGLALPTGLVRVLLTALPASLAVLLMMVQLAMGFPIKEHADRQNREHPDLRDFHGGFPGRPVVPGQTLVVSTTPWFWLAFILTLGVAGGLLIEHLAIFGGRKPPAYTDDT